MYSKKEFITAAVTAHNEYHRNNLIECADMSDAVDYFILKQGQNALDDLLAYSELHQDKDPGNWFRTVCHDLKGCDTDCFVPQTAGYRKLLEAELP